MKKAVFFGAGLVLAFAGASWACSICKCGDPTFFINSARMLPAGKTILTVEHLNLSKSSAHVDPHGGHEDDHGLFKAGAPAGLQHLSGTAEQVQNTVQASLLYGLTSRLQVLAIVPYVFNEMTFVEETSDGKGWGDPEVLATLSLSPNPMGKMNVQAIAGVRLPLGKDDLKDAEGELSDHHLQPGSGAWAGLFGAQALFGSAGLPLYASVSYQLNGSNDHDFSYGDVLRYNFAAQKGLGSVLDVIGEINGRYADYDKEGAEKDANSGGSVVYFSPGLRLRMFTAVSLRAQVQIPVFKDLHGEQDEEVNFRSGLIWEM